ncbi:hypothetical protein EXIGLDRAFT_704562 [Exidia glandulosa HHB12029]|uniref:C2H2-type domain-containing protein n=1 Tax=Exidia glandulosa HHB12029 TaxID=1314781 RepID=A0A165BMP5_EXIGL|nr:hypothetical protein EXIGLDRAFT_704562 [Exidia glandulosa HHB12029]
MFLAWYSEGKSCDRRWDDLPWDTGSAQGATLALKTHATAPLRRVRDCKMLLYDHILCNNVYIAERTMRRSNTPGQPYQNQQQQQQQYQQRQQQHQQQQSAYDYDDDDEEEYESEGDQYDIMHAAQRPHAALSPAGLCIPPQMAFAPLAKLSSQSSSAPPTRGSGAPYVYSPQTFPTPPPPSQGYMHPQLRAPSQPPPGYPQQHASQQQQGEFMVLRPDRRTGNLQVAGASQSTHSGAVHAMRQAPHGMTSSFDANGNATGAEPYNPRAPPAQPGSYVCSVPGCGKRYTFGSNLRRHVRTAHPEIAFRQN